MEDGPPNRRRNPPLQMLQRERVQAEVGSLPEGRKPAESPGDSAGHSAHSQRSRQ